MNNNLEQARKLYLKLSDIRESFAAFDIDMGNQVEKLQNKIYNKYFK